MEVKAQLNNVRISPQKVRIVANTIRGAHVQEALGKLDYDLRRSAPILAKLLRSAIANAEHNAQLKSGNLVISDIQVDAGPTLKRWRPRAFGRASKILKRTSRISIAVAEEQKEVAQEKPVAKKVVKKEAKKATKKATKKIAKKEVK